MNPAYSEILAADAADRRDVFIGAGQRLGTAPQNIEKDFWAYWALDALFNDNSDSWALEYASPSIFREPSGDAVDHWNRFDDDIAVVAALGLNAYRFSIEWARIEPEEGRFSQAALDHYPRCIDACLSHGNEPVITFHHFTAPLCVASASGMADDGFQDRFARCCKHAAEALSGFKIACTLNELNVPLIVPQRVVESLSATVAKVVKDAGNAALGAPIVSFFLLTLPEALVATPWLRTPWGAKPSRLLAPARRPDLGLPPKTSRRNQMPKRCVTPGSLRW